MMYPTRFPESRLKKEGVSSNSVKLPDLKKKNCSLRGISGSLLKRLQQYPTTVINGKQMTMVAVRISIFAKVPATMNCQTLTPIQKQ
jgi:hypothetical protein